MRRGYIINKTTNSEIAGDIKSLLLQAANESTDWANFIKKTEESARVAFPECIANELTVKECRETEENGKEEIAEVRRRDTD